MVWFTFLVKNEQNHGFSSPGLPVWLAPPCLLLLIAEADERIDNRGGNARQERQDDEDARAFAPFANIGENPDSQQNVEDETHQLMSFLT